MSQTLEQIAQKLSTSQVTKKTITKETKQISPKEVAEIKPIPKVQIIYAFNGVGKTRLSRVLRDLIAPKSDDDIDPSEFSQQKILYYNAFTEDLFYWDNDLELGARAKLKIQPNKFTDWVLIGVKDEGLDQEITKNFQTYADEKLTPKFNPEYKTKDENGKDITIPAFSEVTFSYERGDDTDLGNIKISKGEESSFIWSVFYTLLDHVTTILSTDEPEERETDQFNELEYVFIDDPVSSLDENHLIELAVNLSGLIKRASKSNLRFIITTHNPLFYNVLSNEMGRDDKSTGYKSKWLKKYRLDKKEDGSFNLEIQANDSPFSYHLSLMSEIKKAIQNGEVKKYHFHFLRHILEKTSTFLGYKRWEHLLPVTDDGTSDAYASRILNLSSHSKHSGEETALIGDDDRRVLSYLVNHIEKTYGYSNSEEETNASTN